MSNKAIATLRRCLDEKAYVSKTQRRAWKAALLILEMERENRFLKQIVKIETGVDLDGDDDEETR